MVALQAHRRCRRYLGAIADRGEERGHHSGVSAAVTARSLLDGNLFGSARAMIRDDDPPPASEDGAQRRRRAVVTHRALFFVAVAMHDQHT